MLPLGLSPLRRSLVPGPNAPAGARSALEGFRSHIGVDVWERSALALSELVTNSFKHAGQGDGDRIGLMIAVLPVGLRIEVTDAGDGFEPVAVRPDDPSQGVGGWGLVLVDDLSDRWGVDQNHNTRVWCEFDLAQGLLSPSGA